jgi:hypothetical protein
LFGDSVVGSAAQGEVVDVGLFALGPGDDVVDFGVVGRYVTAGV